MPIDHRDILKSTNRYSASNSIRLKLRGIRRKNGYIIKTIQSVIIIQIQAPVARCFSFVEISSLPVHQKIKVQLLKE